MSFVVAIDGPAGSGKGTVAKLVGEKMNLINIDTGAMFRCVALEMLRKKVSLEDEKEIQKILENINIEFKNENKEDKVLLNGEDVSFKIRDEEVSNFVSPISTIKVIRDCLLKLQRRIAENKNIIMEGRDIGTTVFPNADVKIYLTATVEERAKRRIKQNINKGIEADYEAILQNIKDRDERDSNREIAPLKKAEDATLVDSTNMEIEEVVETISNIIIKKQNS